MSVRAIGCDEINPLTEAAHPDAATHDAALLAAVRLTGLRGKDLTLLGNAGVA